MQSASNATRVGAFSEAFTEAGIGGEVTQVAARLLPMQLEFVRLRRLLLKLHVRALRLALFAKRVSVEVVRGKGDVVG